MKYIITGHGRTGTHWVEELLVSCLQGTWELTETQEGLLTSEKDHVIWHTNESLTVSEGLIYRSLIDTVKVIYCYRMGGLAVFASLAVAERTGEWNFYKNDYVEPFEMDVDKLLRDLDHYYVFHDLCMRDLPALYPPDRLSIICYEDLMAAQDRRKFVCDKVGLEYFPEDTLFQFEDETVKRGKNPRKYHEIIKNYAELLRASDEHISRCPPPWVSQ